MGINRLKAEKYLVIANDGKPNLPMGETLPEHRKHCKARKNGHPERCPFENKSDQPDADVKSNSKPSPSKSPSHPSSNSIEKIFAKMEDVFGTTNDVREAGYILPNGKMLDFSGVKLGYHTHDGRRHVDHREITDAVPDRNGSEAMNYVISNGAIRIMPETGGVNLATNPSLAALETLEKVFKHFDGEVQLEISNPDGFSMGGAWYQQGTPSSRIETEIYRYFKDGIPLKGTGEQPDGSFAM